MAHLEGQSVGRRQRGDSCERINPKGIEWRYASVVQEYQHHHKLRISKLNWNYKVAEILYCFLMQDSFHYTTVTIANPAPLKPLNLSSFPFSPQVASLPTTERGQKQSDMKTFTFPLSTLVNRLTSTAILLFYWYSRRNDVLFLFICQLIQ